MSKRVIINTDKPVPAWVKILFAVVFALYASVFAAKQINMLQADLGRHLANGKNFIETHKVLSTNYYSYTQPDFIAINHHWASGVLFYAVQQVAGFKGLSVFYILCVLGGAAFFVAAALQLADVRVVFALAIFVTPLFTSRTEIRPEGVSLFLLGLFFYLLVLFRQNKLSPPVTIAMLGVAQLIWVNCHIFFFMGFMLTGFFLIDELVNNRDKARLKYYFILLAVQTIAGLCNPFFISGLLVPLTIFNDFGYMISENQSIGFMEAKVASPLYTHYKFIGLVLILFATPLIVKKQAQLYLFLPLAFFGLLGYMVVRAIPLFALVAIPGGAFLICNAAANLQAKKHLYVGLAGLAIAIVLVGFINGFIVQNKNSEPGSTYQAPVYFSPVVFNTGLGLYPGLDASARFFLSNNLKGPVFNDYDLGGYLIYYLYGKEKVFVDNRPEAYSVAFFKDTYIPMQQQPEKFRQVEGEYHFNSVWFYMREDSPWARHFLWWLMGQPDYAPVFSDGLTIIFLKRNLQNEAVIKKYEINKSMFGRGE